jgi:hypothetical protein
MVILLLILNFLKALTMSCKLSDLNDIKIQNREYTLSKLETGDLIKLQAEVSPIIYHYGIVEKQGEKLYIYHNQRDKINSNGGNLVCEPLETYIKGRDIISVTKTNLNNKDLSQMYEVLKGYKYDFINFNCEHFVNFATDKRLISNQVFRWGSILAIGILVTYLIRKNKL